MNSIDEGMDPARRLLLLRCAALTAGASSLSACGGGGSTSSTAPGSSATPATPGVVNETVAPAPSPSAPVPAPVASSPVAQAPLPLPPSPPTPAWAASLPTDTWVSLPGTAFTPWAKANIPAGRYYGTAPFESIVNAYSDPANDPWNGAQYFYGGGHGDGSCNAVCKFDHQNLTWSLVGQPTPPSVYLPGYPLAKTYPSGQPFSGWFLSSQELPDARDQAYAAPALARMSTHMYAAAVKRGTRLHYFYSSYAEFDTATGQWMGREVDLGAQLIKFRPQYGTPPLQQGTVAIYDEVSDRMFVTLNPGDAGGGWRTGIMVFNPLTRTIESIHETNADTYGLVSNSMSICRVGRNLYGFTKLGRYSEPTLMNQGFIFNMDSKTYQRFVLTGDTAGSTYPFNNTQETIPSFYDGRAIRRWNYQATERSQIYSVDLQPVSGSGRISDPWVLRQTVRRIAGNAPSRPLFVYSRLMYHGGAQCALVLPEADANWMALRLS